MKVAKIEEHLTDNDLNDLIKEHKDSYNIYRRAYLIKMVKNGDTIKKASEIMNVSRKTGERWVREYNEKGIDGLMPDYSNCGLESELDDEKLQILYEAITTSDKGLTIEDVREMIYTLF
ncbi:MAG: helix-turn-helix domain-containing protein, partial [Methanobrevibacter sp.]|uniref:helix-turn-helix domain-containing protein n=1 Tax=Methanobrevibacter sp. TaxID=66852 RepID=UPI0025F08D06